VSVRNVTVCDNCKTEHEGNGFPKSWRRFAISDLLTGLARQCDLCGDCTRSVTLLELTTKLAIEGNHGNGN
jgi:hypothetical protein